MRLGRIQIIGAKALEGIVNRAASNGHRTTKRESDAVQIMTDFHISRIRKMLRQYPTAMVRPLGKDRIELNWELEGYKIIVVTPIETAENMIHHVIANGGIDANNPDNI